MANSSSAQLKTFKDIQALPARQLNALCEQHGVDVKCGKKARVNLLCQAVGVSTTGGTVGQLFNDSLQKITPQYLSTLKDGWSTDLLTCPDLDEGGVKSYLLKGKTLKEDQRRFYKLSKPYKMKDFIHSLRINPKPLKTSNDFILIKGQCNASQSAQEEDVKTFFVVLDAISGQPLGGYCTCTVG